MKRTSLPSGRLLVSLLTICAGLAVSSAALGLTAHVAVDCSGSFASHRARAVKAVRAAAVGDMEVRVLCFADRVRPIATLPAGAGRGAWASVERRVARAKVEHFTRFGVLTQALVRSVRPGDIVLVLTDDRPAPRRPEALADAGSLRRALAARGVQTCVPDRPESRSSVARCLQNALGRASGHEQPAVQVPTPAERAPVRRIKQGASRSPTAAAR